MKTNRKYVSVKPAPKKADSVKPEYYGNGYDVINLCHDNNLNFTKGSAVKYIVRAGKKGVTTEIVDLEKAIECLNREITYLKSK